jgi:thiol-disulfide isomerase/thioredoxin
MIIINKFSLQKVLLFISVIMITLVLLIGIQSRALAAKAPVSGEADGKSKVLIYEFWGEGCGHCEDEKAFLERMARKYSGIEVKYYEVWGIKSNYEYLEKLLNERNEKFYGVPVTIIGEKIFDGYSKDIGVEQEEAIKYLMNHNVKDIVGSRDGKLIEKQIEPKSNKQNITDEKVSNNFSNANSEVKKSQPALKETKDNQNYLDIPYLGKVNAKTVSIPFITIILAVLDSLNPCSFFVLFSLLGLLTHARSRKRIVVVGLIFALVSGIVYFLFMAAWLNVYMFMANIKYITMIAGAISIIIAALNIKDFFIYKQGVSLTISDSVKTKLLKRMRRLAMSQSVLYLAMGTMVLALVASSYELICTVGFPMVYTRILTLNKLNAMSYYLYLGLYNAIYIMPLLIIVAAFAKYLGKIQISIWQGRVLKLVSGMMMLELGVLLIINPYVFSNILLSSIILLCTIGVSVFAAIIAKRIGFDND